MKESDIPGLLDLKMEYEAKVQELEGYNDLQSEFKRKVIELVRNAIQAENIEPKREMLRSIKLREDSMINMGCGIESCTSCITWCVQCVVNAYQ